MGMIKIPSKAIDFFNQNYQEIFESGSLAEGQWNKKIIEWTRDYTKAKYAQATCSNGSGVLTVLTLLRHYQNYKFVFIQSNTMYGVKTMAVTSGLEYVGAVDCSMPYLMPTFEQAKAFIDQLPEPQHSVFLLTHIGGWTNPDIEVIAAYCKEKRVALVEDCAHSLGSTMNGRHTGLYGVAGVYSLYATKAIPAGEGGIVVSNDDIIGPMLSDFVIYDRFNQKMEVGVNFRLSELSALMVYAVLSETENIIENKYSVAEQYKAACLESGFNFIDPTAGKQRSNLYKFILLSDQPEKDFVNIQAKTSPVYSYALGDDKESICSRHLCLPIWYDLDATVVDQVIEEINTAKVTV